MSLARTSRDIHATSKKLARQRAQEYKLRAYLYNLQAKKADEELGEAELDVGQMSLAVRCSSYFLYPSPAAAIQRYGNSGKSHLSLSRFQLS